MLCKTIDGTIGNTPLVELTNIEKDLKLDARIYGKIEAFNPAGSVKDRIAKEKAKKSRRTSGPHRGGARPEIRMSVR